MRGLDSAALFPEAGRVDAPLDPDRYPAILGATDRLFAALADATNAVLVTLDAPLIDGARAYGVDGRRPGEVTR